MYEFECLTTRETTMLLTPPVVHFRVCATLTSMAAADRIAIQTKLCNL